MLFAGFSAQAGDAAKGKAVFMANCIACHNMDPAKVGPIGPAIKGASKELLEAKVINNTYPAGFKPQRDTKIMPPLPHLKANLDDLAAYLK